MEKSATIPQMSVTCKDKFKLVVTENLERKIRTYCALSPEREWSGVLFYTFEGDFHHGITINANDFYLMDQGSHVHTEFDLNDPTITRYMVFNNLTDHCMGLLHSHCSFNAFFSGEDNGTLRQYGNEMNNFVSLVVSNSGPYVARLTRKTTFKGSKKTIISGSKETILFNTDQKETSTVNKHTEEPIENNELEYIDLSVVMPSESFLDDTIGRFGEINHKCSQERLKSTVFPKGTKDWKVFNQKSAYNNNFTEPKEKGYTPWPPYVKESSPKEAIKQGSLFDDFEVPDVSLMAWEEHGFRRWFNQLLQGSPFDWSIFIVRELETKYSRAFKDEDSFQEWFNAWLDYMLEQFDLSWIHNDMFAPDELLIYKTIESVECLGYFKYKSTIIQTLSERVM